MKCVQKLKKNKTTRTTEEHFQNPRTCKNINTNLRKQLAEKI